MTRDPTKTTAACPRCRARIGEQHQGECDEERCTVCNDQRLWCGCNGHDPVKAAWSGESTWPAPPPLSEKPTIRELMAEADVNTAMAGVYVVHLNENGERGQMHRTQLPKFVRAFDHDNEMVEADRFGRYLGVVHEAGALLVRLDPEPIRPESSLYIDEQGGAW